MSANSYALKIGEFNCAVLLDAIVGLGRDKVVDYFPTVAEADIRQAYTDIGLSLDEALDYFNCFVTKIGGETVLVDTGQGSAHQAYLLASLSLAGFRPDEITQVVLTHSHGDHVFGLLTDDQQPIFPNATYVISSAELAFWQRRIDADRPHERPIVDMMKSRGLRLINGAEEILPGLTTIPIPGHTPGQIALLLESEGEKLMPMADLLHNWMQFAHPEWSPRFDVDASQSVPTRRAMLERAADENLLTLFYHLPFPGLGHVHRAGSSFRWEPLGTG